MDLVANYSYARLKNVNSEAENVQFEVALGKRDGCKVYHRKNNYQYMYLISNLLIS